MNLAHVALSPAAGFVLTFAVAFVIGGLAGAYSLSRSLIDTLDHTNDLRHSARRAADALETRPHEPQYARAILLAALHRTDPVTEETSDDRH